MESKRSENLDTSYCGRMKVESWLYKNKWRATVGLLFGKYVKRYFVLDLQNWTFAYYNDERSNKKSQQHSLQEIESVADVPLTEDIANEYRYGFSVITSDRPYHLFSLNMEDKLMFMYAFSAVLHLKKRPEKTFYENELLSNYPGHYILPKYVNKTKGNYPESRKDELVKPTLSEKTEDFVENFFIKHDNSLKKGAGENSNTSLKLELVKKYIKNRSHQKVRIVSSKEGNVNQSEEVATESKNYHSQRPVALRRHVRGYVKNKNNVSFDFASPFCISPAEPALLVNLSKAEDITTNDAEFEKILKENASQDNSKLSQGRPVAFRRRVPSLMQKSEPVKKENNDDPVEFEEEWNFDIKVNLSSKPNSSSNTTTGVSSKYMRNSKLKNETGKESNNNNDFDYSW